METRTLVNRLHAAVDNIFTRPEVADAQLRDLIHDITVDHYTEMERTSRVMRRQAQDLKPGDVVRGLWDHELHTLAEVEPCGYMIRLAPAPFPGWDYVRLYPETLVTVVPPAAEFNAALARHTARALAEIESNMARGDVL